MNDTRLHKEVITNLRRAIKDLTGNTPASFARSETLGKQWDFANAVPSLERIFGLLVRLHDADLQKIPKDRLLSLAKVTKLLASILNRMTEYAPKATSEVPDFEQSRVKILNECQNLEKSAFDLISPLLAYLASCDMDNEAIETERNATISYLQAMRSEAEEHVKDAKAESDKILQSLRDTSADVAVSAQASFFQCEAKKHNKNRSSWLVATVVVGLVTLTFSVGAMLGWWTSSVVSEPAREMDSYQVASAIARMTVPNLFVFGILSFGTVWCGRNYRAESHNVVVNRHRLNALRVFPALVNATEDPRTKNAVLIGATQCIFAHQSSGFTPTERDSSGTKATDFIRNLVPGSE